MQCLPEEVLMPIVKAAVRASCSSTTIKMICKSFSHAVASLNALGELPRPHLYIGRFCIRADVA